MNRTIIINKHDKAKEISEGSVWLKLENNEPYIACLIKNSYVAISLRSGLPNKPLAQTLMKSTEGLFFFSNNPIITVNNRELK